MVKFIFSVYDKYTGEKIAQVITNNDSMLETIKTLNELGLVKGSILDDKENNDDN